MIRNFPLLYSAWGALKGASNCVECLAQAARKAPELSTVWVQPDSLAKARHVVVTTVRNEGVRLNYFLTHYETLGFEHFIIIDNESCEDVLPLVAGRDNVSLIRASGSYAASHFGRDWINHVLSTYCRGKWCLAVDADELFIYPDFERRSVQSLTAHLEAIGRSSLFALLLDMYSDKAIEEVALESGQNPLQVCPFFDRSGYEFRFHPPSCTTRVKGGPRMRVFAAGKSEEAPALHKVPLVLWGRGFAYGSSTHLLWPRRLNHACRPGCNDPTGILLHFKFTRTLRGKVHEELSRREHYRNGLEYEMYDKALKAGPLQLISDVTDRFTGSRSLIECGLMSSGGLLHPNDGGRSFPGRARV